VAGLLRPEKGTVIFHDEESPGGRHSGEVSHYLGHRNAMKNELTFAENLYFWRAFLGNTGSAAALSASRNQERPTASVASSTER
ncbi:cytochrome C biogenesis protein, partial [Rhizobium johnstonii]